MTEISTSEAREVERQTINSNVEELDKTLNSALYDIGFLRGTIGNKLVGEKIKDSYSGHAVDVGIRSVIQKSLLFVTRSWDHNSNSIPKVIEQMRGWGTELENDRKARRPDFPNDFLEIGQVEDKISKLAVDAESFLNCEEFLAAKLHRDEHVAHLLKGRSGYRRKLERLGIEVDPITYDQVVQLGTKTANFITRILQIWQFTVKNEEDWIKTFEKNTRMLWEALPVLAITEKEQWD